jgi:erythromycin esterase-like protein
MAALVRWMRHWNVTAPASKQLSFLGMDVVLDRALAADTLETYVKTALPTLGNVASSFGSAYRKAASQRSTADREALAGLARIQAAHATDQGAIVARLGARQYALHAHLLRILAQSLALPDTSGMSPDERSNAGGARRARAMAANTLALLAVDGPDARGVMLAHNAHVSTQREFRYDTVFFYGRDNPIVFGKESGAFLSDTLGAGYYALGLEFDHGSLTNFIDGDPERGGLRTYTLSSAEAHSFPWLLGQACAAACFVDLAGAGQRGVLPVWFHDRQRVSSIYGSYGSNTTRYALRRPSTYDGVWYVRVAEGSRKLPASPGPP